MLRTRLWMGALLIVLTAGMLVGDRYVPGFPFLFVFLLGLSLAGARELIDLLGRGREPQRPICYLGLACLACANWAVHLVPGITSPWLVLLAIPTGFLWLVILYEMSGFTGPGRAVERMATTWLIFGYLGLLPTFFVQLRWLYPDDAARGSLCLALAAFVPKACDIGAYFTGRLLGRHPMTPVLSPKKTWEGAVGGLAVAALAAVGLDRLDPASSVLRGSLPLQVGFGVTVGAAGMLGDLAESLLKRDCQRKDASAVVPGFGGILDVLDAVIYAAPVAFLWLTLAKTLP